MNNSKGETLKILKNKGFNVPDLKLINLKALKKNKQKKLLKFVNILKELKLL